MEPLFLIAFTYVCGGGRGGAREGRGPFSPGGAPKPYPGMRAGLGPDVAQEGLERVVWELGAVGAHERDHGQEQDAAATKGGSARTTLGTLSPTLALAPT